MWTFSQSAGILTRPDGSHAPTTACYAGHGAAVDNPADQFIRNVGPLPQGMYIIGAAQNGTHLGPVAMPLTPAATDDMEGRGGFWLHADEFAHPGQELASEGCLVVEPMTMRQEIAASADRTLEVIE